MDDYPLLQRLTPLFRLSRIRGCEGTVTFLLDGDNGAQACTPVELLRLSNELMDLALNAIDPEG
jgi:hypothetical protein